MKGTGCTWIKPNLMKTLDPVLHKLKNFTNLQNSY